MKCTNLIVFLFGIFLPSISSRHVQFYRKDYTYSEEFDAFYKVHWDLNGMSWNSAFLNCDDEGASLFYPKVKGEWALVKNMTDKMTQVPNVTEIFVGFHDEFEIGEFITVDGHSTPYPLLGDELRVDNELHDHCILMDITTGLFKVGSCRRKSPLPFVCKKLEDQSCPTVDRDYKYVKVSKKCYKINKRPKIWKEAMQTCFMEGGILAVIEYSAELKTINDMANNISNNLKQRYFVGFRKNVSTQNYYTVKGQSEVFQYPEFVDFSKLTVEEVQTRGSEHYGAIRNRDSYECGALYSDGELITTSAHCSEKLPFICEIEVTV